jgi:hypothetical protein
MLSVYLEGPEYLDKYANHPYHVEKVKSYMAQRGPTASQSITNWIKKKHPNGCFFSPSSKQGE